MVSKTVLLQKSGISNLLQRKKSVSQQQKTVKQTSIPTQQVQVSQTDIEAQKKYEADLAAYNQSLAEQAEWEQAEKFVLTGKRYDPKSTVGKKIDYIYEHGGRTAILGSASMEKPIAPIISSSQGEIKTPPGWSPKGAVELAGKYRDILLSEKQQKQLSQFEQMGIITSNPDYQREYNALASKPEAIASITKFAKNFNYINPEQYGKVYTPQYLSPIESQSAREQAERIRENQSKNIFQAADKLLSGKYESQKKFERGFPERKTPIKSKTYNESEYFRPLNYVSKKIEESKAGKKFLEKHPFFKTGETKEGKKVLDVQKTNLFMRNLGLGIFFSIAMGSGQQAVLESPQEYIYDYTKGRWVKKNKITGEIIDDMTRTQATGEFGRLSEERQLAILKKAFRENIDENGNVLERVYLDKKTLLADIEKSKTFMRESGLTELQIEERLTKLFPDLYKTSVVQSSGFALDNTPSMVGGTGLKIIPKQRMGQYDMFFSQEQAMNIKQAGGVTGSLSENKFNVLSSEKNLFIQPSAVFQEGKVKTIQKETQRFSPLLMSKTSQKPQQVSREISILKEESKLNQPQKEKLSLISLLRIPQLNKQIQKTPQTKPPKPQEREKPPEEPTRWFRNVKKKIQLEPKKSGEEFSILGRRFGKFKIIGKSKEKSEAENILKKFLKGGLGASGKILKGGKELNFDELMFGGEYRKGKRSPSLIVQKRKYRLSSPLEKSEIQYFKRKSGKKSKKNSGFSLWGI